MQLSISYIFHFVGRAKLLCLEFDRLLDLQFWINSVIQAVSSSGVYMYHVNLLVRNSSIILLLVKFASMYTLF